MVYYRISKKPVWRYHNKNDVQYTQHEILHSLNLTLYHVTTEGKQINLNVLIIICLRCFTEEWIIIMICDLHVHMCDKSHLYLSTCDFYLWGFLKNMVYETNWMCYQLHWLYHFAPCTVCLNMITETQKCIDLKGVLFPTFLVKNNI